MKTIRFGNSLGRVAAVVFFMAAMVITETSPVVSQHIGCIATQGEFAVKLVEAVGMQSLLSEATSVEECIALLETLGITPPGGFQAGEELSKKDIAVLMVKAKNLEGEVLERTKLLKKEGFVDIEKARVMKLEGEVLFKKGSQQEWKPVRQGMELVQGDSVKTAAQAYVDLRVGTFGAIRVKESTEIVLRELTARRNRKKGDVEIFIARGEVLSKTVRLPRGSSYVTVSPTTVAAVRGTIQSHKVTPDGDVITSAESKVIAWIVNALGEPIGDKILIGEGMTTTALPGGFGPLGDADRDLLVRMRAAAQELLNEMGEVERQWAWFMLQQWTRDHVQAAEKLLKNKGVDMSCGCNALHSVSAADGENKVGNGTNPWASKTNGGSWADPNLPNLAMSGTIRDHHQNGKPPFVQELFGPTGGGTQTSGGIASASICVCDGCACDPCDKQIIP